MRNDTINVLLYSALPPKIQGGIATWTNTYLTECKQHSINCKLVNCVAEGARADNPEARLSLKDEIKRTLRIFSDLRKTLKCNYDLAHVNTSCGSMGIIRDCLAVKLIKAKGTKVTLHFHCDIPFWVKSNLGKKCLKSLCNNSDLILVLCENSASYLRENCSVESVIVPNFVSCDSIVKTRNTKQECEQIIYVGGVQPQKGCYELFDAAKKCPTKSFVLVGQLDDAVDISSISDNVELVGSVSHDKVLNMLDASDIFLFPSHSEGFSLSLAEAMARGLPVITTDVGANVWMHENKGGITIPMNDASKIVDAINQLDNGLLREKMSFWNIEKIKENYTSTKVLDRFSELYYSII